jgi:hypothetical protein
MGGGALAELGHHVGELGAGPLDLAARAAAFGDDRGQQQRGQRGGAVDGLRGDHVDEQDMAGEGAGTSRDDDDRG